MGDGAYLIALTGVAVGGVGYIDSLEGYIAKFVAGCVKHGRKSSARTSGV